MEQSAEQDAGRAFWRLWLDALKTLVACFHDIHLFHKCFHDLSGGMFSADSRAKTSLLVVPCRMSPVKRAEVHPSRLGCPSLFFFSRILEPAKDP